MKPTSEKTDNEAELDLVKARTILKKKPSSKYVVSVEDHDIENDVSLLAIQTDDFNSKDQGSMHDDLEDSIV